MNVALQVAQTRLLPREGRGPLPRADRRAARPARRAALGVPRGRRPPASATATARSPPTAGADAADGRRRPRRRRRCSRTDGARGQLRRHPRRRRRVASPSRPGEIVGIIGPNGAGKTTLFDLISGLPAARRRPGASSTGVDVTVAAARPAGPPRASAGRSRTPASSRRSPSTRSIAVACERWVERPRPDLGRPAPAQRLRRRAQGRRPGRRAARAARPRALPVDVRPRAVDRHPPHRRPRLPARPPPDGRPPRRAVARHRPARDRGARPAAAPHPRGAPAPPSSSSSTTCRSLRSVVDRLVAMDQGARHRRRARPPTSCTTPPSSPSYLGTTDAAIDRSTAPPDRQRPTRPDDAAHAASSPTPSDEGGSGSSLRRWGPIVAIVAVLAIVAGVVVIAGGDDDDDDDARRRRPTTTEPASTAHGADGRHHLRRGRGGGPRRHLPGRRATRRPAGSPSPYYFAPRVLRQRRGQRRRHRRRRHRRHHQGRRVPRARATTRSSTSSPRPIAQRRHQRRRSRRPTRATPRCSTPRTRPTAATVELEFLEGQRQRHRRGRGPGRRRPGRRGDGRLRGLGRPGAQRTAGAEELAARGVVCIGCFGARPSPSPNVFTLAAGEPDQVNIQPGRVHRSRSWPATRPSTPATRRCRTRSGSSATSASSPARDVGAERRGASGRARARAASSSPSSCRTRSTRPACRSRRRRHHRPAQGRRRHHASSSRATRRPGAPSPGRPPPRSTSPSGSSAGSALVDTTAFARTYDQEQWAHAFGISPLAARTEPRREAAPVPYEWYFGEEPPADDTDNVLEPQPADLLRRPPGRGPRTSRRETLLQALYTVDLVGEHPHPGRLLLRRPRLYPTLDPPDHNGIDDFTEIWWDPEEVGPRRDRPGGPRLVPVRRRRPPLPAGRLGGGRAGLRPRGRGLGLRRAARGGGRSRTSIRPAADRFERPDGLRRVPANLRNPSARTPTIRTSG